MTLVPRMDDLEPGIPADERRALDELATRLVRDRPLPRPGFRGDLRRSLQAASQRSARGFRAFALAFFAGGALLLGVAGLSLVGQGPLAPAAGAAQQTQQAPIAHP